jgi:hypothetical protein
MPRYLDEAVLENPPLALANAARETLRMGDTVEAMLRGVMTALMNNDRKLANDVSRMDNVVDRLNEAIKLYITKLTRDSLDEYEGHRAMEIVSFTINLEHIGDIIDKNLCELAVKKIKRRYQFSAEGAAELTAFHCAPSEQSCLAEETRSVDLGPQSAGDALAKLAYTRAVVHETLRLYPPAFVLARLAIERDEADDIVIPAGAVVMISPWVLHRHVRLWDRPDTFMPSRFLGEEPRAEPGKTQAKRLCPLARICGLPSWSFTLSA